MLRKKRGVVGSAKSRSPLDQPPRTPFLLQQQGASRMSIANTIMEGQLPMNSFQDELERHAVQNQFAGSLFPQQTEVMQVDGALKRARLVLADFAFTGNMTGLVDGFIDIGRDTWETQLRNEIGKVERSAMSTNEFKNFLEHDFAFSNVSPAIDLLSTMMGSESVPAPTPDEVATITARIRAHDPTLLTDTRALIKILKSPELWSVLYSEYQVLKGYANTVWSWMQYLVAQLRKVATDYNLPKPPWFDSPPGGDGGGGGGAPPPPPPSGGTGAPPADPTAPPSMQRGDTTDQADPTLETTPTPPSGTASSPNIAPTTLTPPTPPSAPTVQPPTTPNTGMGLRYHPRTGPGAPPPPPSMPPNTPSPLQDDMVLPQYTPYYMAVIQYILVPLATGYGAWRTITRLVNIPPAPRDIDNAVEGGAQQRITALFYFLLVNHTAQFFESNLARYIVEHVVDGNPFFMGTRFGEWIRTLVQQVAVNTVQGEALFPDPTEIPASTLSPLQSAQRLLQYYRSLTATRNQAIIEAIQRYIDTFGQVGGGEGRVQTRQNVPDAQQTPERGVRDNRIVNEVNEETRRYRVASEGGIAYPLDTLQALRLFITLARDAQYTGGQSPNFPGETTPAGVRDALNALLAYYNDATKKFNNIIVGDTIDDRTMNRIFSPGDQRGIIELLEFARGQIAENLASVALSDALVGVRESLYALILRQMNLILRATQTGNAYEVSRKTSGQKADPIP